MTDTDRAEVLRHRIATYRRHLAEKPDIEFARHFLARIVEDQAEIERIEGGEGIVPEATRK